MALGTKDINVQPAMAGPRRSSFNAKSWMQRFSAVGGYVWSLNGRLHIGWELEGFTPEQNQRARSIYGEIERDEDRRRAVKCIAAGVVGRC